MPLPKAIDNNILRSKQIIFFTDGMMDKIKYKKNPNHVIRVFKFWRERDWYF
jgi:hypothetical protein